MPRVSAKPAKLRDQPIAYRIFVLATLLRRAAAAAIWDRKKLSQVEARHIAFVGEYPGLSLGQLAFELGLDLGQVSRALTSLARRGYVLRKNERGRQIAVFLTPQGMRLYRGFIRVSLERNRALVEGLSDKDVQKFVQTLDIILNRARVLTGTRNLID